MIIKKIKVYGDVHKIVILINISKTKKWFDVPTIMVRGFLTLIYNLFKNADFY